MIQANGVPKARYFMEWHRHSIEIQGNKNYQDKITRFYDSCKTREMLAGCNDLLQDPPKNRMMDSDIKHQEPHVRFNNGIPDRTIFTCHFKLYFFIFRYKVAEFIFNNPAAFPLCPLQAFKALRMDSISVASSFKGSTVRFVGAVPATVSAG